MIDTDPQRQFKGVWIPAEIWLHPKLTWLQKCVVAEIDSLSSLQRPCFASNEFLAARFNLSKQRMAHLLCELRKLDIIETITFDGRARGMRAKMALSKPPAVSKAALSVSDIQTCRFPTRQNVPSYIGEKTVRGGRAPQSASPPLKDTERISLEKEYERNLRRLDGLSGDPSLLDDGDRAERKRLRARNHKIEAAIHIPL